ncbi:3'-5' exonuclease [Isoptericola halotolerans]|uniref:DNA polymerase-3 subunit epsilon n=1 Tax=Isoptericola halotolerans TaxID=300560 RepID=A0ABX2A6K2_9MICO|nr:3'-5' exonuclease [Isoptericola halotolerans]NOV98340.1 DNA polymerase-3 subunit epsilon [Isoptericola halotolerans]
MSTMSHIALEGLSFTAIDFETANPKRASVCSVGLAKVRDGVVVDTLETLVQPPSGVQSFNHYNVAVHGITAQAVLGAPTWDVVYPKVAEFAGADALVAHNAAFDRSVLTQASAACGIVLPRTRWLCTRDTARSVLDLASYKLPDVSTALNIPDHDHHDAGADARQCALVLIGLCRRLGTDGQSLVRQHSRTW